MRRRSSSWPVFVLTRVAPRARWLVGALVQPAAGDGQAVGAVLGIGGVAVADVAAPAALGAGDVGAAVDAGLGLGYFFGGTGAAALGKGGRVVLGPAPVLVQDAVLVGRVV